MTPVNLTATLKFLRRSSNTAGGTSTPGTTPTAPSKRGPKDNQLLIDQALQRSASEETNGSRTTAGADSPGRSLDAGMSASTSASASASDKDREGDTDTDTDSDVSWETPTGSPRPRQGPFASANSILVHGESPSTTDHKSSDKRSKKSSRDALSPDTAPRRVPSDLSKHERELLQLRMGRNTPDQRAGTPLSEEEILFNNTSTNSRRRNSTSSITESIAADTPPQHSGKNKNKKKHKHKHKDKGPISLAILIETGILIKSRKPTQSELQDKAVARVSRQMSNSRVSLASSATSFRSSVDTDSSFETASLISCVTCLSDEFDDGRSSVSSMETGTTSSSTNHIHHMHTADNKDGTSANKTAFNYTSMNGQLPTNSVISYNRILNAELVENEDKIKRYAIVKNRSSNQHLIRITFANPTRHDVKPKCLTLMIEDDRNKETVVEAILSRSYRHSKRNRSVLVIINPFGGKKNAKKIFKKKARPLLLASNFNVDIVYTKYACHAVDIAKNMDISKYDTIACASGDGIPHEVINGLYRRPDRVEVFNKVAITEIPCGSGNAMSVSCHWTNNPSYATLFLIKSVEKRIDVMCCSEPSTLSSYPRLSFLSQTYGIIAESDINTEFIRWMGPARFELGVAFNILQRKKYPCDIYVKYHAKSKNDLKSHYLKYKREQVNDDQDRLEKVELIEPEIRYIDDDDSSDTSISDQSGDLNLTNEITMQEGMSSMNDDDNDDVTEEDFEIKYKFEDGVPSDWEKIDSHITNNLGIFYSGKMPYVAADTKFFPAALPADGCMDMVITDSRTPFTRMIPILLALDKGSHVLQPEVLHSKILAYKLIPKVEDGDNGREGTPDSDDSHEDVPTPDGLYSIDGEKFPLEPLQVEVMPRLCKTLLRDGRYVDTQFDKM